MKKFLILFIITISTLTLINCESSNVTGGTNGIDGIDGMTIQVLDNNGNLLGYSISDDLLFSPNGYLYPISIVDGNISFEYNDDYVYFTTTDCTGEGFVKDTSSTALRNMIIYDSKNGVFREKRDTTSYTKAIKSSSVDGVCNTLTQTLSVNYYDEITRAEIGIPENIQLPLTYEFK